MSMQWDCKKQMIVRNSCLDLRQRNILKHTWYKKYSHILIQSVRNVPLFPYNFSVWCESLFKHRECLCGQRGKRQKDLQQINEAGDLWRWESVMGDLNLSTSRLAGLVLNFCHMHGSVNWTLHIRGQPWEFCSLDLSWAIRRWRFLHEELEQRKLYDLSLFPSITYHFFLIVIT